jgi:CDGSH-type Zn-finger protein
MARVVIKCAANGPNLIELDGTVFAAMCRCGATNTKTLLRWLSCKNWIQGRS